MSRGVDAIAGLLAGLLLAGSAGRAAAQEFPTSDPSYAAPNTALGQVREGFGAPGVMVISSDFDIRFLHQTDSLGSADRSGTSLTLSPNLQFFVANDLAVGGVFTLQHETWESVTTLGLALGPSLSYNLAVGEKSSLYPTLALTYGWSKVTMDQEGGSLSRSGNALTLIIKVPFLFHPFPHVFVGFGPIISLDLSAEVEGQDTFKSQILGLVLDIGFWL